MLLARNVILLLFWAISTGSFAQFQTYTPVRAYTSPTTYTPVTTTPISTNTNTMVTNTYIIQQKKMTSDGQIYNYSYEGLREYLNSPSTKIPRKLRKRFEIALAKYD